MTRQDVFDAVGVLAETERGRKVAQDLLGLLARGGLGLDARGQNAVVVLLGAAWGPYSGTVMDALAERNPDRRPAAVSNGLFQG